MKLYETLEKQLKKEPNYLTDDGNLKKWVVINKAQNYDAELLEYLLDEPTLKEKFFLEVKNILVFNQSLFVQFLEQKNYLNDSYTAYKNKVGLNIDGKYLKQRNEVTLVWPFKDCVLEGGQSREEDKRDEIFFNETLAQDEITQLLEPKVLTNAKRFDNKGFKSLVEFNRNEHGVITDNLIIKGNNLLALHTLKEEFAGKVKVIYIDPPYNTRTDANTFAYNNSFNHSTWLTFMKNRLEVARKLLREDGIIFIDIDHYELFYLGVLADEIFGYENRIGVLAVVHNLKGRYNEFFSPAHENKVVYAKNRLHAKIYEYSHDNSKDYPLEDEISKYKIIGLQRTGDGSTREERPNLFYPIYYNNETKEISLIQKEGFFEILPIDSSGVERRWRWGKEKVLNEWRTEIIIKKSEGSFKLYTKIRIKGEKPKSLWMRPEYSGTTGTNDLKNLMGENAFSYPKSVSLVKDSIQVSTDKNDIILDFFGGSGTTAQAVLELNNEDGGNRQFILCEQMHYINTVTVPRISKVVSKFGAKGFTYLELKKHNQNFIEQIEVAKDTKAVLKIWEEMKTKSFLNYNVDIQKQEEHIEEFKALSLEEQKQHLVELLDKNQLYVNLSSLNDKDFAVSAEDKKVTQDFYQLKK